MRKDIYGVSREVRSSKELGSSEFAVITVGSARPTLVQSMSYNYGREVSTVYEVGSSGIYFQTGRGSGRAELGRVVGRDGFQSLLQSNQGDCGIISGITVQLNGNECNAKPNGRARISFDAGIITEVGGSFTSGQLNISESATLLLAGMVIN